MTEKTVLYRTIVRMIDRGNTNGLAEKIDVFYLGNRISKDEYLELTAMLAAV